MKIKNLSLPLKTKIISSFLFKTLILPILEFPHFNGTLIYNFQNNNERNPKIKNLKIVMKKLCSGELFNSNNKNEYLYTVFNPYFLEIMPFLFQIIDEITTSKLPKNIEELLEIKKKSGNAGNNQEIQKRNIDFNFLKNHPEERLEHQLIFLTLKDLQIILDIIKSNDEYILGDKNNTFYKTYKKITYHLDNLAELVEEDEKNYKMSVIYFSKLIFDNELKEKMSLKKENKLSFKALGKADENDNEKFTFKKIKFCINTIIKHLNILSRNNFIDNKTESGDFIAEINKILKLEGFSEILKEKKLPLEWLGLYLQSNIDTIPSQYKENNYQLLYNELLEESNQNLRKLMNDDSLNIIYSKIINNNKILELEKSNLNKIKDNKLKLEIFEYLMKKKINVIMEITWEEANQDNEDYQNKPKEKEKRNKTDKKYKKDKKDKKEKKSEEPKPEIVTQIKIINEDKENKENKDNKTNKANKVNKVNKANNPKSTEKNVQIVKSKNFLDFCNNFPNLLSEDLEEEGLLIEALNQYLDEVFDDLFKKFPQVNDKDKEKMTNLVENYLHVQLYVKLFKVDHESANDFFKKMIRLSWIEPKMLDEGLQYIDQKMYQLMVYFFCKMDYEMSPKNKLRVFKNLILLINDIVVLYEFDSPDISKKILFYIVIKARLYNIISIIRYIEYYINESIKEKQHIYFTKFKELIVYIDSFDEKQLKNISKEEFDKRCNEALK